MCFTCNLGPVDALLSTYGCTGAEKVVVLLSDGEPSVRMPDTLSRADRAMRGATVEVGAGAPVDDEWTSISTLSTTGQLEDWLEEDLVQAVCQCIKTYQRRPA